MKAKTLIFLLILAATGCAHKIDVQQGNVLTKEMLDQLAVGMSARQVISLAGAPLVVDPFHNNRWDYVYHMQMGNSGENQYSYVTLFFNGQHLKEIEVHAQPLKEDDINAPELVKEGRT
jgi:outer membrane protein assembly factor BamE